MNTLALNDLTIGSELDSQALASITGKGTWHRFYASVSTGSWGSYRNFYNSYKGITFHGGYLKRHYVRGYQRTRTQTETSYWNNYVTV